MSNEIGIPISYESSIAGKERKVQQEFTKDGEKIKVSLFSFSNDGDKTTELLLALIKDFNNMVETYDLLNTLTVTKVID